MKFIFGFIIAIATGISAQAAKPSFVALSTSSPNYVIGQASILTARILIQPTNPAHEIFLVARLNGSEVKVTSLNSDQSVAISEPFTSTGIKTWDVGVYLQDREKSKRYNEIMEFYRLENLELEQRLLVETDPGIRADLIAHRDRNYNLIARTRDLLWQGRRAIEEKSLTVNVAASREARILENPVIQVELDHSNGIYVVGERTTFFVSILTEFTGTDGIQEVLASGDIATGDQNQPWLPLARKRIGPKDFAFTSPVYVAADVGTRKFTSQVQIRSKAQADSVRASIQAASQKRAQLIVDRNSTQDPMRQAWLNRQIAEMDQTLNLLNQELVSMLVTVGTSQELFFSILQN